eukprot:TRINITY_DN3917_c0_g1_i7.p1 TRINITY_DN3917_c0_g1~~TRINITY_DN3917_c0_g1_i7.p1  ORF type:complete len:388 (-),score=32.40 TRINITY_DN3917_c0_g1_i7:17-1180(-)
MQRAFASSDEKRLRTSIAIVTYAPFISIMPCVLIGLISVTLFNSDSVRSDQVFTLLMRMLLSKGGFAYWIVSVLMAATVASIMSTADSILMGISSLICLNVVKAHFWKNITEKKNIIVSKITSVVVLAISVTATNFFHLDLKDMLIVQMGILMQAAPSFYLGLYLTTPVLTSFALITGLIIGNLASIVIVILFKKPFGVDAGIYGLGLNLLTVLIICFITWARGDTKNDDQAIPLAPLFNVEDQKETYGPSAETHIQSVIGGIENKKEDVAKEISLEEENNELIQDEKIGNENSSQRVESNEVIDYPKNIKLDLNARHPGKFIVCWFLLLLYVAAFFPFYRKPGTQDAFILGFPIWAFVSLVISFVTVLYITFSTIFLWKSAKVTIN